MDKKSFNLVTEPWIQVLDKDGNPKEVSLLEVFENAASYQRLAGDMASQDLVILRLLVDECRQSRRCDCSKIPRCALSQRCQWR